MPTDSFLKPVKPAQRGKDAERALIAVLMDVGNPDPVSVRLDRAGIDMYQLRELLDSNSFDVELYEYCKAALLIPAMAQVTHTLATRAAAGDANYTRMYLELIGKLKSHGDVNVQLNQYSQLSDMELERRIESEVKRLKGD